MFKACSKRSFSKNSYHIETSRLTCVANQLTGFCMIRVFTGRSFRIVYTTSGINFLYQQRPYVNRRTKRFVLVAAPNFMDWLLHAYLHTVVYFLVLLFRIVSVRVEYEKVWTIIRRPQSFKTSSIVVFLHILYITFPLIRATRILVKAKRFFICNKSLVKLGIAPPLTAQKMKFSIKDFFSKYEQIRSFLRICSYLLKKSLMENFIFCAVSIQKLIPVN